MTVPPNLADPPPVTRDVSKELAKQRAEKRRAGGSPSPIQFNKDLLVGYVALSVLSVRASP